MYGPVPVAGLTLYMVMSIRVLSPVSVFVVGAAVVAVAAGGGNGSIPLPLPADVLEAYMWERNEGKCVGCGITFALDAPQLVRRRKRRIRSGMVIRNRMPNTYTHVKSNALRDSLPRTIVATTPSNA